MLPGSLHDLSSGKWFKTVSSLIVALISATINGLLLNYLGDAVRYFSPRPGNIVARQEIRKAGISLLRRLHEQRDDKGHNLYDRIIVVGHSLGTVIAYDILCLYWNQIGEKLKAEPADIDIIEQAASDFNHGKIGLEAFREAQFEFWLSQHKNPGSWRVSDFITTGSPLAFADLHLAKNAAELEVKKQQREFPTCPPVTEPPTSKQRERLTNPDKTEWFSFPASDNRAPRTLHHAAPFSMTRWTNMFFKNDFVGGPVTCLGPGVENKEFVSKTNGKLPFVSHTHYWDPKEEESLAFLKSKMQLTFASVGIADESESESR